LDPELDGTGGDAVELGGQVTWSGVTDSGQDALLEEASGAGAGWGPEHQDATIGEPGSGAMSGLGFSGLAGVDGGMDAGSSGGVFAARADWSGDT